MTQFKTYRYLGRNGIITSRVLLDGISHILMYELRADEGMILTDGNRFTKATIVDASELENWHEITDNTAKADE